MISLSDFHKKYQMLIRFSVKVTVGFAMVFTSVQALGSSSSWGGCLISVGTDTATSPVTEMLNLPENKEELIATWSGLFLFDNNLKKIDIVNSEATDAVRAMQNLPGIHQVLIGAINGVFRYDVKLRKVFKADGERTVPVIGLHPLPDGKGVLIGTWNGLFLFDIGLEKVVMVEGERTGPVVGMYNLAGGNGVLISTWGGVFRFDPGSKKVVIVSKTKVGKVADTLALPGGSKLDDPKILPEGDKALIGAENGLFLSEKSPVEVVEVPGSKINSVTAIHDLPGGPEVLIGAKNGVFLFNKNSSTTKSADGVYTGSVYDTQDLPEGKGIIIAAANGFFLFDKALGKIVLADGEKIGHVYVMHDLPETNGILIGAEKGLFRFDIASTKVVSVGGANTGTVYEAHDLPGRNGLLIGASNGWFQLDTSSLEVVPAGGERTGPVFAIDKLPESDTMLVGAQNGLYKIPSLPLSKASVVPISKTPFLKDVAQVVNLRISHPCASQSNELGLILSVSRNGVEQKTEQWGEINRIKKTEMMPESAEVTSTVTFKEIGDWQLQLFQAKGAVGTPVRISVRGQTWIEYFMSVWPQLMFMLSAIYIILFLALLAFSHYSLTVFRMLTDPAWGAKLLTWPFFLLRHVPAMQRWMLEPWFQNVRRTLLAAEAPPFLDPPVRNAKGEMLTSSALLSELTSRKRVWLHGRIGMGKSAIFMSWARAYYCDPENTTLADIVRKYGFILVMLPVRDYAMIQPPDSGNPESWVIEVISRRFKQFGLPLGDATLLTAMLRAGHIAIALDGTNEADCNQAITSFGSQYPQVKIVATSQSDAQENWSTWYLPKTISEQRTGLLTLWFKSIESGRALDERLASEGNVEIVSGYDLRLLFELMESDPSRTPIPDGRIGLYCAVLSKATRGDGDQLDLVPLRQLAVQMIVEGRRAFSAEEGDALGDGVTDILSKDSPRAIRKARKSWEFRHDQMRAFLAACSLAEDSPTMKQLISRVEEGGMFRLRRDDQEALWGFLADLLSDKNLRALWIYAQSEPEERGLLQGALQRIADQRKMQLSRPVAG
ncbi:hypothetical protein [Pseudomonas sp. PSB11]|uniref:hypothetical protein n=1 Tax=Pseudomonas sp. PSB11 TaxID=2021969 RepID=UPI001660D9B9|nr:hypothetical protein [Pseudomonas sp. PSB11]MBD0678664.1 hypothetical protein [Pseudomonas sp. PSB11]